MSYGDETVAAMKAGAVLAAGALAGAAVAHVRKRNHLWGAARGVFWTATAGLWAGWMLDA